MSLVKGDNSYGDLQGFRDFAEARNITIPQDDPDAEILLVKALDYLFTITWQGIKTDPEQTLDWPRRGVWAHGRPVEADHIPSAIETAQYALAAAAQDADLMPVASGPVVRRRRVGPIEREFAVKDGDIHRGIYLPFVDGLLAPYKAQADIMKVMRG